MACGESTMFDGRVASLVRGCLHDGPAPDGIPDSWRKFEIIQHTSASHPFFDFDMSIDIVQGLADFFAPCFCVMETDGGVLCGTVDEYRQYMLRQKKPEEELGDDSSPDSLHEMTIRDSGGRPLMRLLLRNWNTWGGIDPYCDSYAYECYLSDDCAVALQNHFLGIFAEKGSWLTGFSAAAKRAAGKREEAFSDGFGNGSAAGLIPVEAGRIFFRAAAPDRFGAFAIRRNGDYCNVRRKRSSAWVTGVEIWVQILLPLFCCW